YNIRENPLVARIEERIADVLEWPIDAAEGIEVIRYQCGGEYKPHLDFSPRHLRAEYVAGSEDSKRRATLIMYLASPNAGGETYFPHLRLRIAAIPGNALFFCYDPKDLDDSTLHAGQPVSNGEKWIATKWLHELPGQCCHPPTSSHAEHTSVSAWLSDKFF